MGMEGASWGVASPRAIHLCNELGLSASLPGLVCLGQRGHPGLAPCPPLAGCPAGRDVWLGSPRSLRANGRVLDAQAPS